YAAKHNVGKVAQYAVRVWDVPESDDLQAVAMEGIARFKAFLHSIGMPVTLRELGIENPDIDLLVRKFHEDKGKVAGNYVHLDSQASREIYELAR
ncbi:iron-containing alcohol dehydrogenase, partial [Phocaeicola coprocola]